MSFNVPAKSNNRGIEATLQPKTWVETGTVGGMPWSRPRDFTYQDYYQLKTGNNDPYIENGFKLPKGYKRFIARVFDNEPCVLQEGATPEYSIQWAYPLAGSLEPPTLDINQTGTNLMNRLRTTALLRLRGEHTMEFGADLAESRSTVNMIAENSANVLYAYRSARRGNWQLAAKHLGIYGKSRVVGKTASSKWLELQYGWMPLMGSIYDGHQLLKEGFRKRQVFNASAKGSEELSKEEVIPDVANQQLKEVIFGRVKLWYEVENATTDLIDRAGLLNPLSVAWEVVPFSFVLDWFIPVGNVLSALTATAGLQFVGGLEDEIREKEQTCSRHFVPRKDWSMKHPGSFRSRSLYFNRVGLRSFPSPAFYANTSPFSTKRVLNAIALIRQLF